MINKTPDPLKSNLCFCGIIRAGQLELRRKWWVGREQHHWGDVFRKALPQSQHREAVFPRWPGLYLCWWPKLVMFTKVVLVLKVMENSWGLALGGRTGVLTYFLWSWKEPRKGYWWKCRLDAVEDPRILETPVLWRDHQEQQQLWSGASLSLGDSLCRLQRMELEKWLRSFGGAQTLDTKLFTQLEFSFALFCLWLCPTSSFLERRMYLTYFLFYRTCWMWRPCKYYGWQGQEEIQLNTTSLVGTGSNF